MKHTFILLCIILFLTGCSKKTDTAISFREVYQYLPFHTDTARSYLNELPKKLHPKDRATRDLLHLYINDLSSWNYQNDSLAFRIILSNHTYSNSREQALSLYYKGVFLIEQQKYGQALESFHLSEREAEKDDNHHLLGMIYMKSSEIFYEKVLYNTAIKYARKSCESFLEAGDELRANRACGMQLLSLLELREEEEFSTLYQKVKQKCTEYNDTDFFRFLANELMYIYLSYERTYEAGLIDADLKKINPSDSLNVMPMQWVYQASHTIEQKKIKEAWNILKTADSIVQEPYERATLHQAYINYYKAIGDYKSAFDAMEKHLSIYDSLFNAKQRLSLVRLESRAQNFQLENNLKKATILRQRIISGALFTILLFIIIIAAYRNKVRKQRDELDNRLAIVSELKQSNQSLLSKLDTHREKENQLKEQIESKLEYAKVLADLYSKFPDKPGTILKKMNETMDLAPANKEFTTTIIHSVNLYYNHAIDRLTKAHPTLNNSEILFSALIIAGFSINEMALILNSNSVDAVYTRKYRLRHKLTLSKQVELESYLQSFSEEKPVE